VSLNGKRLLGVAIRVETGEKNRMSLRIHKKGLNSQRGLGRRNVR